MNTLLRENFFTPKDICEHMQLKIEIPDDLILPKNYEKLVIDYLRTIATLNAYSREQVTVQMKYPIKGGYKFHEIDPLSYFLLKRVQASKYYTKKYRKAVTANGVPSVFFVSTQKSTAIARLLNEMVNDTRPLPKALKGVFQASTIGEALRFYIRHANIIASESIEKLLYINKHLRSLLKMCFT